MSSSNLGFNSSFFLASAAASSIFFFSLSLDLATAAFSLLQPSLDLQ
jgi:hypothetical protein